MQDIITFLTAHSTLSTAILLVLIAIMIIESIRTKRQSVLRNPQEITQLINHEKAVVLDLRSQEDFKQGHIIDAKQINSTELRGNLNKLDKYRARPIVAVCGTGTDSQKFAAYLVKNGYNAYALQGGLRSWLEAQMPLVKES